MVPSRFLMDIDVRSSDHPQNSQVALQAAGTTKQPLHEFKSAPEPPQNIIEIFDNFMSEFRDLHGTWLSGLL